MQRPTCPLLILIGKQSALHLQDVMVDIGFHRERLSLSSEAVSNSQLDSITAELLVNILSFFYANMSCGF